MSLVTMFLALPPTALAPSWTPFHENSLNDLSSSWPMSVTIPILRPPPRSPPPPQPATTTPKARPSARRRFMFLVRPPSIRRAGARRADSRSGEDAPQKVTNEHDVEASSDHERGQRQCVLARPDAELDVDEEAGDQREHGRNGAVLPELPGREQDADRHRERRLKDHRAGHVAQSDHVLAVACPDERVRRFGKLGGERCQDEGDQERVEVHRVREVLDEVREETRAKQDRAERDERLREDQPQRRRRVPQPDPDPPEEAHEGQLVEGLALLHLLLDVLGRPPRCAEHQIEIEEVRG